MRVRGSRVGKALLVVALTAGLVATTSVDVSVASQRRAHDRKIAAVKARVRAERRYLDALRPVAVSVSTSVRPVEAILSGLESDPRPGDVFFARDAIRHAGMVPALTAARTRLSGLAVPPAMRPFQARLQKSLTAMLTDARDVAGALRGGNGEKLYSAINGTFTSTLGQDGSDWILASQEAFARQHEVPPTGPLSIHGVPPSLPAWIYATDVECWQTFDTMAPIYKRLHDHTVRPADFVTASSTIDKLTARLRRVPLPAGPAGSKLRREVIVRLSTMHASARALGALGHAIERQDAAAIRGWLGRFEAAGHSVGPLGQALRAAGPTTCADFVETTLQISSQQSKRGSVAV